jgi:hypothetical protein
LAREGVDAREWPTKVPRSPSKGIFDRRPLLRTRI